MKKTKRKQLMALLIIGTLLVSGHQYIQASNDATVPSVPTSSEMTVGGGNYGDCVRIYDSSRKCSSTSRN